MPLFSFCLETCSHKDLSIRQRSLYIGGRRLIESNNLLLSYRAEIISKRYSKIKLINVQ